MNPELWKLKRENTANALPPSRVLAGGRQVAAVVGLDAASLSGRGVSDSRDHRTPCHEFVLAEGAA